MKPALMIRHKIGLGLAAMFVLALAVIYVVVEGKVKPDLTQERQTQIQASQDALLSLMEAKLDQVQLLTSSLALAASTLPKDVDLYKQVFPSIIDNHGDPAIAGGGIWPEPNAFTAGVDRRSFFWARSGNGIELLEDYNDPQGSGYHQESWYTVGRNAPIDRCSWSPAYTDPVTKIPMVTCTIPYKLNGKFAGVATVDMMLGGISNILTTYGEEQEGYVFALDAQGQMLSFPQKTAAIVNPDDSMVTADALAKKLPWMSAVLSQARSVSGSMMMELENDGIVGGDAFVDFVKEPKTGWVIGLVVPKSVITQTAQSMGIFIMLAVGALLIIVSIAAFLFFRSLLAKLEQTTAQINVLVSGDTAQELDVGVLNEIGDLRQAVNAYGDKLKSLLLSINAESGRLVSDAGKLKAFSNEFLNKANSLSDENHTLAAATEEFGSTSADVANYSNQTKETVERIHQDVRTSGKEMEGVIQIMRALSGTMNKAQQNILQLDEDSRKAHGMLGVIRDIAEQTNLLALNAAIEAARAGETGRGFAVVADEVRALASRTQESTLEINSIIEKLQQNANTAVNVMNTGHEAVNTCVTEAEKAQQALRSIQEQISDINAMNLRIATSAEEQSAVSDTVKSNVDEITDISNSNAEGASMAICKTREMSQSIAALNESIGQFSIEESINHS